VDGRTYVPTDGRTFPPLMLLGRLKGVDLKSSTIRGDTFHSPDVTNISLKVTAE